MTYTVEQYEREIKSMEKTLMQLTGMLKGKGHNDNVKTLDMVDKLIHERNQLMHQLVLSQNAVEACMKRKEWLEKLTANLIVDDNRNRSSSTDLT